LHPFELVLHQNDIFQRRKGVAEGAHLRIPFSRRNTSISS
jgi:hypothetical protein